MRWTRRLAAAVLGGGLVLAASAPPAWAGGIFDGAGYKLTGIRMMTMTFTMPRVVCPESGTADLEIGIFAPDSSWAVAAGANCLDGQHLYGSFVDYSGNSRGLETTDDLSGDRFQVVLKRLHGSSQLTVTDLDASGYGNSAATRQHTSVVAAGADPRIRALPIPAFADTTIRVSVNGGEPFTAFNPVRHVLYRGDTKLIGTGFPWNDGHHFTLYFKHA